MSKIVYTREVESDAIFDSSLVDEVYYNENNGDLFIDLDGPVYQYYNVPVDLVNEFENADSAGAFYNTKIKGKFSSSELGSWSTCDYEEVEVVSAPTATLTAGQSNVYISVNGTTTNTDGSVSFTGGINKTNDVFSLKPFSPVEKVEGVERSYSVVFEVDGLTGRKTHNLKSTSVDEAIETVRNLGKMLDLTFIVREVVITL